MPDNIKTLYDRLAKTGFDDLGTEDEFRAYVKDTNNVKTLHQTLADKGFDDLGSEQEFQDYISPKPAQPAATTQTEDQTNGWAPTPVKQKVQTQPKPKPQPRQTRTVTTGYAGSKKPNYQAGYKPVQPTPPAMLARPQGQTRLIQALVQRQNSINQHFDNTPVRKAVKREERRQHTPASRTAPRSIARTVAQTADSTYARQGYTDKDLKDNKETHLEDVQTIYNQELQKALASGSESAAQDATQATYQRMNQLGYDLEAADDAGSVGNAVYNAIAPSAQGVGDKATSDIFDQVIKGAEADANAVWKKYNEDSKYVDAASPWSIETAREANEKLDPDLLSDKLLKAIDQQGYNRIFNDVLAKAKKYGYKPEDYFKTYVLDNMKNLATEKLEKYQMQRFMPHSDFEYVLNGFSNGMSGMFFDWLTKNGKTNQYKQTAQQTYQPKSTTARIANQAVSLIGQAPEFALSGGVASAATKKLCGKAIADMVAKGATEMEANRILAATLASKFGQRVANTVMQSVVSGAANFAALEGMSEAARQVRDEDYDAGKIAEKALHGAGSGAVFGTIGGAYAGATAEFTGASKIISNLLGVPVNGAALTASNNVMNEINMAMGGQDEIGDKSLWEQWADNSMQDLMMRGTSVHNAKTAMGLLHKSTREQSLAQILSPFGGRSNSQKAIGDSRWSAGGFSKEAQDRLMKITHTDNLRDALMYGAPGAKDKFAIQGKRETVQPKNQSVDDIMRAEQRQIMAENWDKIMNDRDLPAADKAQLAAMMQAKYHYNPTVNLITYAGDDGKIYVEERDAKGLLNVRHEFGNGQEADEFVANNSNTVQTTKVRSKVYALGDAGKATVCANAMRYAMQPDAEGNVPTQEEQTKRSKEYTQRFLDGKLTPEEMTQLDDDLDQSMLLAGGVDKIKVVNHDDGTASVQYTKNGIPVRTDHYESAESANQAADRDMFYQEQNQIRSMEDDVSDQYSQQNGYIRQHDGEPVTQAMFEAENGLNSGDVEQALTGYDEEQRDAVRDQLLQNGATQVDFTTMPNGKIRTLEQEQIARRYADWLKNGGQEKAAEAAGQQTVTETPADQTSEQPITTGDNEVAGNEDQPGSTHVASYDAGRKAIETNDMAAIARIQDDKELSEKRVQAIIPANNTINEDVMSLTNSNQHQQAHDLVDAATDLTDEQKNVLHQYIDADAAIDGINDAQSEAVTAAQQQNEQAIRNISDKQGNVTILITDDNKTVHVIDGNINDKNATIMVREIDQDRNPIGQPYQIKFRNIKRVIPSVEAKNLIFDENKRIQQQMDLAYDEQLANSKFAPGNRVTLKYDNNLIQATVVGVNEDGSINFQPDGADPFSLPADQAQQMVKDGHDEGIKLILEQERQQREAARKAAEEAARAEAEAKARAEAEAAAAAAERERLKDPKNRLKRTPEGKVDWTNSNPDDVAEVFGKNMAKGMTAAQGELAKVQAAIDAANTAEPATEIDSADALLAEDEADAQKSAQLQELERQKAFWEDQINRINTHKAEEAAKIQAEENRRAAEKLKREKAEQRRLAAYNKPINDARKAMADDPDALEIMSEQNREPRTLEEAVADLIPLHSLVLKNWDAAGVHHKGIEGELGVNAADMKKLMPFIGKVENGATDIETLAERIWELLPESIRNQAPGADSDVRNMLIKILSEAQTADDIIHFVDNARIREAQDAYAARQAYEKEAALHEQEKAATEEGADQKLNAPGSHVQLDANGKPIDTNQMPFSIGKTDTQKQRDDHNEDVRSNGGLLLDENTTSIDNDHLNLINSIARQLHLTVKVDPRLIQLDVNGKADTTNRIVYISPDTAEDTAEFLRTIFGHELTHIIKAGDKDVQAAWNDFTEIVKKALGDEEFEAQVQETLERYHDAYEQMRNDAKKELKRTDLTEEERKELTNQANMKDIDRDGAIEEVIADFVGEHIFTDEQYVKDLVEHVEKSNADASGILKRMRDLLDGVLRYFKSIRNLTSQQRQSMEAVQRMRDLFGDAYELTAVRQKEKAEAKAKAEEQQKLKVAVDKAMELTEYKADASDLGNEGKAHWEIYTNPTLTEMRKQVQEVSTQFGGHIGGAFAGAFNYDGEMHGTPDYRRQRIIGWDMADVLDKYDAALQIAKAQYPDKGVRAQAVFDKEIQKVREAKDWYEEFAQGGNEHIDDHQGIRYNVGKDLTLKENENSVIYEDENGDSILQSGDGGIDVKFSKSSWKDKGEAALRRQLNKARNRYLTDKEADEIWDTMQAIYNVADDLSNMKDSADNPLYRAFADVQEMKPKVDKDGNVYLSVVKANDEYPMNIDFSKSCVKREAMNTVLDALLQDPRFDIWTMTDEDYLNVKEICKKYGLEIPCYGCFVENSRYRIASWSKEISNEWNQIVQAAVGKDNVTDFDIEGGKRTAPEVFDRKALHKAVIRLAAQHMKENKDSKPKAWYANVEQAMLKNPSLIHTMNPDMMVSPKRWEQLLQTHPDLVGPIRAFSAQGTPNMVVPDTIYNSDILDLDAQGKGWSIDSAFDIGGVRLQSASDWKPKLFFDYCQVFADIASKKLPAHTYTKVLAYAKIYGMTGVKVNMSLFPKAMLPAGLRQEFNAMTKKAKESDERYIDACLHAGLKWDAINGQWTDDYAWSTESFPVEEAYALQDDDRYTANCGTMAVGLSDAHIWRMMKDPRIRSIIPFHKSNNNPSEAQRTNVDIHTDYTKHQNDCIANKGYEMQEGETYADYYKRIAGYKGVMKAQYGKKIDPEQRSKFNAPNWYDCLNETQDPVEAGKLFVQKCQENGIVPRFPEFVYNEDGTYNNEYYKVIQDFTTVDKNGKYVPQRAVMMGRDHMPEDWKNILTDALSKEEKTQMGIRGKLNDVVNDVIAAHNSGDQVIAPEPADRAPEPEKANEGVKFSEDNMEPGSAEEHQSQTKFSIVKNPKEKKRLDSEETITAYHSMQIVTINGKRYLLPPMAAVTDGKFVEGIPLNDDGSIVPTWEKSDERPDLAVMKTVKDLAVPQDAKLITGEDGKLYYKQVDKNHRVVTDKEGNPTWYFNLQKGEKGQDKGDDGKKLTPVLAAYDPYQHSSTSPLNDQFTTAYNRSNLVTVRVAIPKSEAEAGEDAYRAEKAALPVGTHDWKKGNVAGKVKDPKNKRQVILSRWDKPLEIVSDADVAKEIAKVMRSEEIDTMPFNVVTPGVRDELVKLGIKIGDPTKGTAGDASKPAYEEWKAQQNNTAKQAESSQPLFAVTKRRSPGEKITKDNYYSATEVQWHRISDDKPSDEILKEWKDMKDNSSFEFKASPKSDSEYLIDEKAGDVYRCANHWKYVGDCLWPVDSENALGEGKNRWTIAKVNINEFKDLLQDPDKAKLTKVMSHRNMEDLQPPTTLEKTKSIVNDIINDSKIVSGNYRIFGIANVTDRQKRDITDINLDNFIHTLSAANIRKNNTDNKKHFSRGELQITDTDYAKIPDILESYDTIEYINKSGTKKLDRIKYTKIEPDGQIYYYEEVQNGKKQLAFRSLKKKNAPISYGSHLQEAGTRTPEAVPQPGNIPFDGKGTENISNDQKNSGNNSANGENNEEKPLFSISKTPKQKQREESATFKRWFGDWQNDPDNASKVVDEEGKPLIVHHGTLPGLYGFTVFNTYPVNLNGNRPGDFGKGSNLGSHFGNMEQAKEVNGGRDKIYNVYLNIKHPFETFDFFAGTAEDLLQAADDLRRRVDTPEADKLFLKLKNVYGDIIDDMMNADTDEAWNLAAEWDGKQTKKQDEMFYSVMRDMLKQGGYDGLVYDNLYDGEGVSYVALEPNQIKSADTEGPMANNGEFDSNNPDIRFSVAKTPEQEKREDSKPFKDWFGDWQKDPANASKVVNKNGEPLVVYHGTSNWDFNSFDKAKIGSTSKEDNEGFFFISNRQYAQDYAEEFTDNPRVIAAYVNIRKPLVIDADTISKKYNRAGDPEGPVVWDLYKNEILKEAHKNNCDGVIIEDEYGQKLCIPFEPNQIKSATDNNGDFDPENPDIRFSVAKTPEQEKREESKPFKNWFGDWQNDPDNASKVVDADGKPQIMAHGSTEYGFTVFDTKTNRSGQTSMGTHFGSHQAAQDRLSDLYGEYETAEDHSGEIYNVYLNIRKPWECTDWFDMNDSWMIADLAKLARDNKGNKEVRKYWNQIKKLESWTDDYTDKQLANADFNDDDIYELDSYNTDNMSPLYEAARGMIQAAGYDGIKYWNDAEGNGYSWVAFEPNQIKSAEVEGPMANTGEFDSNNPDIRFSIPVPEGKTKAQLQAETNADLARQQNRVRQDDTLSDVVRKGMAIREADKAVQRQQTIADNTIKPGDTLDTVIRKAEALKTATQEDDQPMFAMSKREQRAHEANERRKAREKRKADEAQAAIRKKVVDEINHLMGDHHMTVMNKSSLAKLLKEVQNTTDQNLLTTVARVRTVVNKLTDKSQQREIDRMLKLKTQDVNGKNMSIAKNVSESVRNVINMIQGRVVDLKATGYENDMTDLRRHNNGIRSENFRLNNQLYFLRQEKPEGDRTQDQIDADIKTAEDKIAENNAQYDKNLEMLRDLKVKKAEAEAAKALAGDADVNEEIKELMKKMDEHVEGKATWTLSDSEKLTGLEILQIKGQADQKRRDIEKMEGQLADLEDSLDHLKREAKKPSRYVPVQRIEQLEQQVASMKNAINAMTTEMIGDQGNLIDMIDELIKEGKDSLQRRVEAKKNRKFEMLHGILSDIQGRKSIPQDQDEAEETHKESTVKKLFSSQLHSFEYLAKRINENTLGEDGWFYNHFVKGPEGVMQAQDNYLNGVREAAEILDAKAKEIYHGKTFNEAAMENAPVNDHPGVYLQMDEAGFPIMEEIPLSKGRAMYIYMVWKMPDGKMKLELQGVTEETIAQIREFIGDENAEYADWIQEEFLKNQRAKYNERYVEMYNTSMANIENYVPLKIRKEARDPKSNMSEDAAAQKSMEERVGSLINRRFNTKPVDWTHSAFEVIAEHVNQMEEWNAFAKVRKDLDYVLGSAYVRNQLDANSKGRYEQLYAASAIAAHAYHPDPAEFMDEVVAWLTKGLVGGNIAFRDTTAMKQVLSVPAFLGYSQDPRYLVALLKNIGVQYGENAPAVIANMISKGFSSKGFDLTYNGKGVKYQGGIKYADQGSKKSIMSKNIMWCMKNVPSFRDRVMKGTAGMEFMDEQLKGWVGKAIDKYLDYGMATNQMIDAITCSIGIKTIYDYKYGKMSKAINEDPDLTPEEKKIKLEEAHRLALNDASIYYNATQQSNHAAFMAPMQLSKSMLNRAFSVYQNASIGYARQFATASENLWKMADLRHPFDRPNWKRMQATYADRYMTDDPTLTRKEALKQANRYMQGQAVHNAVNAALYGFLMNWLWDLGGAGLLGFWWWSSQNDDKEKQLREERGLEDNKALDLTELAGKMAELSSYPLRGLTGMNMSSAFINGNLQHPLLFYTEMDEIKQQLQKYWKDEDYVGIASAAFFKGLRITGFDWRVWQNVVEGYSGLAKDACTANRDGDAMLNLMFALNTPNSNRRAVAEEIYKNEDLDTYVRNIMKAAKYTDNEYMALLPGMKLLTAKKQLEIFKEFALNHLSDAEISKLKSTQKELVKQFKSIDELQTAYNKEKDPTLKSAIGKQLIKLMKEEQPEKAETSEELLAKAKKNLMVTDVKNKAYLGMCNSNDCWEDACLTDLRHSLKKVKDDFDDMKMDSPEQAELDSIAHKEEFKQYMVVQKLSTKISELKGKMEKIDRQTAKDSLMTAIRDLRKSALGVKKQ